MMKSPGVDSNRVGNTISRAGSRPEDATEGQDLWQSQLQKTESKGLPWKQGDDCTTSCGGACRLPEPFVQDL